MFYMAIVCIGFKMKLYNLNLRFIRAFLGVLLLCIGCVAQAVVITPASEEGECYINLGFFIADAYKISWEYKEGRVTVNISDKSKPSITSQDLPSDKKFEDIVLDNGSIVRGLAWIASGNFMNTSKKGWSINRNKKFWFIEVKGTNGIDQRDVKCLVTYKKSDGQIIGTNGAYDLADKYLYEIRGTAPDDPTPRI
jgi:hypothetical protein